jgi:hypothetical protein
MALTTRDAFLKDLAESSYELTVRAYNVCKDLGFVTLRDLHEFIVKHGDFKTVRNCGNKTNLELLEFHKTFYTDAFEEQEGEETINKESVISDQSFEYLIEGEFEKLSVRAKNAILNFTGQELPNKEFVKENFIDRGFKASKLRNVGSKTVDEIDNFVKRCVDIYFKSDNNEVIEMELATLQLNDIVGFEVKEEFYLEKFIVKQFPLLAFCSKYFNEILGLDSLEGYVLQNHFQMLDRTYTLDELGKKFNLTRERVRQKREKTFEKAVVIFSRLSPLILNTDYENLIMGKTFIKIPDDIENENLQNEIEEVGMIFAAFLLGLIFKETMHSISPNDKLERPDKIQLYDRYKSFKRIRGSYLINNTIIGKTVMIGVLNEIFQNICIRQEEDQLYDLKILANSNFKPELGYVLSEVIENEFELKVCGGQYTVKRTSVLRVFEYAKDALEKIGKPAHVNQIMSQIIKDHPDFDIETSLSSAMGHQKNIFIFFGRSSTFGLKIWEEKYQNVKGGTIRDIVEEFLNQYDEPCHTSAITEYVNKYRKTEEHSIVNNLKMSGEKRFIFLKYGYVGLVGKNYKKTQQTFKPNEISLDDLMKNIFSSNS